MKSRSDELVFNANYQVYRRRDSLIFDGPGEKFAVEDEERIIENFITNVQLGQTIEIDPTSELIGFLVGRDVFLPAGEEHLPESDPLVSILASGRHLLERGPRGALLPDKRPKVEVITSKTAWGERISDTLRVFGAKPRSCSEGRAPDQPDLLVAAAWHNDLELLENTNQRAITSRTPAVFATFDGSTIQIGPFYVPTESACYTCYSQRCWSNLSYPVEAIAKRKENLVAGGAIPDHSVSIAIGLQVLAVRSMIFCSALHHIVRPGEVIDLDLISFQARRGKVLKLPTCPSCGTWRPDHLPENQSIRATDVE